MTYTSPIITTSAIVKIPIVSDLFNALSELAIKLWDRPIALIALSILVILGYIAFSEKPVKQMFGLKKRKKK